MTDTRLSRRAMLRTAGVATAAAGLAVAAPGVATAGWGHGWGRRIPKDRIGIQLYTLRDAFEADLEGTMEALADIGYRSVELAGTYGRSAKEFRRVLDRYRLRAISAHVDFNGADVDQLIDDAKTIGYRTADCAYANYGTIAEWTDFAKRLDKAGKAFRKAGIKYGYHNHAHEFQAIDGVRPIDVIARHTSRHNIHFEHDLYWIVSGGADPVREFYRYFGRVTQFHVKDRAEDGSFADLGTGTIDFRRLFRDTWVGQLKDYIVEHDAPTDPVNTAAVGYRYLANLRF
ncbi:sugar phosphate isomerase [Prauserella marina]|uniref:Sugar phosphate isomerase/epimerase n=1 Tax=Prauserella marina TaxID=530584 RepID=A0A222VMM4_9PSEU|nr:sugar phosphate isomerase/epimerase [Prauserella marina]ASR34971.1 sugar phosphate isomerase [Prauserella marina]PWV85307.1 sugar phosphate isomerase/epimerase [Prauserella marina]SDC00072.1 Sugar phosphate isomerase/epimerase [Prauserella marina]